MTTTNGFRVIGTRPIRHDGIDKVTGRAVYGADVQMAGLLHGRALRRGVGEVPIVPPPAALANAIYRAAGVRMDELPMSPGRVTAKLLAKK
jgi:CO/xanthine dehydrogenase Mo-binding subunit